MCNDGPALGWETALEGERAPWGSGAMVRHPAGHAAGRVYVVFGSTVLVAVWLSIGVLGVAVGLLWLRTVERSRRSRAQGTLRLTRPAAKPSRPESREPDALAG
jgi:hypothetical protein